MKIISNETGILKEIFEVFDVLGVGRMDSMDFLGVVLLAVKGSVEDMIQNVLLIWSHTGKFITRDEYHYYLDSLTSGIIIVGLSKAKISKGDRARRVKSEDIEVLTESVFGKEDELSHDVFKERLLKDKRVKGLLGLQEKFREANLRMKKTKLDLIQIRTLLG